MWYLGLKLGSVTPIHDGSLPGDIQALGTSTFNITGAISLNLYGPYQMTDDLYDVILTQRYIDPYEPYYDELINLPREVIDHHGDYNYFIFNRWSANEDTCIFVTDYATALKGGQLHPDFTNSPVFSAVTNIMKDGCEFNITPPLPKPLSSSFPENDSISKDMYSTYPTIYGKADGTIETDYSDYIVINVVRILNKNVTDVANNVDYDILESWFGTLNQKKDPSRDYMRTTSNSYYLPDIINGNSDLIQLYKNPISKS